VEKMAENCDGTYVVSIRLTSIEEVGGITPGTVHASLPAVESGYAGVTVNCHMCSNSHCIKCRTSSGVQSCAERMMSLNASRLSSVSVEVPRSSKKYTCF
jgi:hypothetical protein